MTDQSSNGADKGGAKSGEKLYPVNKTFQGTLRRDGKKYVAGDKVKLPEEEAGKLATLGVIDQ